MTWLIVLAYLYSIVDNVTGALTAIQWLTFFGAAIFSIFFWGMQIYKEEIDELYQKDKIEAPERDRRIQGVDSRFTTPIRLIIKVSLIMWVVATSVKVFIPSSEGMKYIAGAAIVSYSAESISQIEGIKELPANVVELINTLVEDITDDIKGGDPAASTPTTSEEKK